MAIADAENRFMWASSGYPRNSHAAMIFKSTYLYHRITDENFLPPCIMASEIEIFPVLLGDSAFPILPSVMKPY